MNFHKEGSRWRWEEMRVEEPQLAASHVWCSPGCKVGNDNVVFLCRSAVAPRAGASMAGGGAPAPQPAYANHYNISAQIRGRSVWVPPVEGLPPNRSSAAVVQLEPNVNGRKGNLLRQPDDRRRPSVLFSIFINSDIHQSYNNLLLTRMDKLINDGLTMATMKSVRIKDPSVRIDFRKERRDFAVLESDLPSDLTPCATDKDNWRRSATWRTVFTNSRPVIRKSINQLTRFYIHGHGVLISIDLYK